MLVMDRKVTGREKQCVGNPGNAAAAHLPDRQSPHRP
jgi:hypothetical protein